jgi:flagella synthesis protein FlgN
MGVVAKRPRTHNTTFAGVNMSLSHPNPASGRNTAQAPTASAIAEHLTQDIAACQALISLMQAEREALQGRDADSLGAIIEQKASHLQRLEHSAAERTLWAQHAQASDPESAWRQMLEDLRQPELSQQWGELKALMVQCREQNETNGKLLARSQHTFGRLLNIMRGQSEAPSLYTAKGGRSGGNSSHNFGEA